MTRSPTPKAPGLALAAVLALAATAGAQSVELLSLGIKVHNLSGPTVSIDAFGTINLGANGTGGNLRLRDADGSPRVDLLGGPADLIVGGGDDAGDIILRDNDGTTTSINLQGQFGFVQLGSPDEDGDLRLWDNEPDNEFSINLDGATGNVTNQFAGNGLVKAWARINANGSVHSCWRCDPSETLRTFEGGYLVSFSPVAADIRGRPRLAFLEAPGVGSSSGQINASDDPARTDRIFLKTSNSSGDWADRSFSLIVF